MLLCTVGVCSVDVLDLRNQSSMDPSDLFNELLSKMTMESRLADGLKVHKEEVYPRFQR